MNFEKIRIEVWSLLLSFIKYFKLLSIKDLFRKAFRVHFFASTAI